MDQTPDKKGLRKKIVYIGNFRLPWTTENDIKQAFESIGWEVVPFQENELTLENYHQVLLAEKDCDFLLYTRTWAQTDHIWRRIIKQTARKTVAFHLDLYIGLDRGHNLQDDSFFACDYVFSADCGHQDVFEKLGIRHFPLPPGVNERSCYLGEPRAEFTQDVIFVGSYNYHTEWRYRQELINWLKATYQNRFTLYPNEKISCVRGEDLNALYNSAAVIVGDSTYSPYYWSDRIPETLGRGGFLIHPLVEGLNKEFELWKHLVPYEIGDWKTLKMLIDYYLTQPKERNQIRLAGLEHVKTKHTYRQKVQHIIDTVCS